ncbi:MAG: hypothetical protein ABI237_06935 [Ginsengibacter sp.]
MNKLLMKTSLLLVTVLIINVSHPQSINVEGVVKDPLNKQPLANASVIIKSIANVAFTKTIISDNNGLYSFKVYIK